MISFGLTLCEKCDYNIQLIDGHDQFSSAVDFEEQSEFVSTRPMHANSALVPLLPLPFQGMFIYLKEESNSSPFYSCCVSYIIQRPLN